MTDIFVKIDTETRALKIQNHTEKGFKKISIGDVSKNTLSNIFLKALDDSDMQSPSKQTEIDTEQNFWKYFFQQKNIDSNPSIDPILKNYIELFLENLKEEKNNLTKKENEIQELEKGLTSENAERKQCVSQYGDAESVADGEHIIKEIITDCLSKVESPKTLPSTSTESFEDDSFSILEPKKLPTSTESSETTPLESTKLLELQKARIEWLQNSISIDNNKDRINKLMKVINEISFDGKDNLINKIKKENTSFEINDQKLNKALIDAYCSIIGEKNISDKISKELLEELPGVDVNVEGKKFKETLQKHVDSLTPQSKATDKIYQLLKRDYDHITQIPQDQYLDNITDHQLKIIKDEIIRSQGIKDKKDEEEILKKSKEELKTFLIRNPQIINEHYEGLHVNADINEVDRTITITDVKEYGLGNKIGLKSGDVIEITDEVDINEAIISIRNFNHEFIKIIKSGNGEGKPNVINELKKIKLQSYDNTRSHLLSNYYNPNHRGALEEVKETIDDIDKEIKDIQQRNENLVQKEQVEKLKTDLEALKEELTTSIGKISEDLRGQIKAPGDQAAILANLQAKQDEQAEKLFAIETSLATQEEESKVPINTMRVAPNSAAVRSYSSAARKYETEDREASVTAAAEKKDIEAKIQTINTHITESDISLETLRKNLVEYITGQEHFNKEIKERIEEWTKELSTASIQELRGKLSPSPDQELDQKVEDLITQMDDFRTEKVRHDEELEKLNTDLESINQGLITERSANRRLFVSQAAEQRRAEQILLEGKVRALQEGEKVLEGKLETALEEFKTAQEAMKNEIAKGKVVSEEAKTDLEALKTELTVSIGEKPSPEDLKVLLGDLEKKVTATQKRELDKINAEQEKNKTELEGRLRVQGEGLEASREAQGDLSKQVNSLEERLVRLETLSTTPSTENKSAQGGVAHGPLAQPLGSVQARNLGLWATREGARGVVEEEPVVRSSGRTKSADHKKVPGGYPQSPSARPTSSDRGKSSRGK